MNLEQLRHIVTLARTKSYARAARELNLSQPVLSRSIQTIEQRYGVRLFDRGRFGASLTPIGATIIEEADEVLRRADILRHTMVRLRQGDGGELNFGITSIAEAIILPDLLTILLAERPTMRIRVRTQSASALLQGLAAEELEFFVCGDLGLTTHADVVIERIGRIQTGLFVRRGHPLAKAGEIDVDALAKYPRIGPSMTPQLRDYDPNVACESHGVLLKVVKKTDAIWSTSSSAVADDPELVQLDSRLARVRSSRLLLVTLPHRQLSMLAQAAVCHMRMILNGLVNGSGDSPAAH